ncbi:MAG: Ppx/GppA phosphatase family protein [Coriobacteriia bacterium]|nr:Ppx/GppA phosphatase family protein [Coriobacteriia bacterium]
MQTKRYAAIDIGTVTCRMLIAEVGPDGITALDREYGIVNLGEDVDATGALKPEAIERVEVKVREYLETLKGFQTPEQPEIPIIAMATSASRDASNASEFVERLRALGIELTVIPGEREAALSFAGATAAFPGETLLVVDVGGGSTELIVGRAGEDPLMVHSFNIGCRRVTERFFHSDPPSADEVAASDTWMRAQFQEYFDEAAARGIAIDRMVAVAGTATSVVSIHKEMTVYDSSQVHGFPVTKAVLDGIRDRLLAMTVEQRRHIVGLDPDRAPVIAAGMIILEAVVELAGTDGYTTSEADILEGIVMDAARNE